MNHDNFTTYQAVAVQSRAQRVIKNHLSTFLNQKGLTIMQWTIIGLVADAAKSGVRVSDLAQTLDTSLAFITTSVNVLEAKGFVQRVGHSHDSRSKLVRLAKGFEKQVTKIESDLKEKQEELIYSNINQKEVAAYFKTLCQIADMD